MFVSIRGSEYGFVLLGLRLDSFWGDGEYGDVE